MLPVTEMVSRPRATRSRVKRMLGLGKQGKVLFFRDLLAHLRHSEDKFVVAPGIRGLVMLVFTLPSFPYVFKIIKDRFGPNKEGDRASVAAKYLLVKQVDRVGRMADTLEFSFAALPRHRFAPDLLEELRRQVPSMLEEEGGDVVIEHLYIERRMVPLNLYLDQATPEQIDQAVQDYGNAIRELAIANIFPGDMGMNGGSWACGRDNGPRCGKCCCAATGAPPSLPIPSW